ncbi:MAG: hypothetical protein IPO09_11565 [Anaeromyxobacter sp.]|nr:hypothetical protein [Anaeromyxobacter sp.]MBL0276893.1 hypothetical protein [Anaeromyxobacter sp.]
MNRKDLKRWLAKARDIQWDHQHMVRRKGKLERLRWDPALAALSVPRKVSAAR